MAPLFLFFVFLRSLLIFSPSLLHQFDTTSRPHHYDIKLLLLSLSLWFVFQVFSNFSLHDLGSPEFVEKELNRD